MNKSMPHQHITITNARVNNLKNISVQIPKNKLVVITGLSGSGKSSLAFDTIYAEGQRRYAESLNAYARQFMDLQDKPDVDEITGLSPTIAIDQKNTSKNPRSTVGTSTEIHDYLRLLFARIGTQYCPDCHLPAKGYTIGNIVETIRKIGRNNSPITIIAPLLHQHPGKKKDITSRLEETGYETFRLNGLPMKLPQITGYSFDPQKKYDLDVVLTTLEDTKKQPLQTIVEKALDLGNDILILINEETGDELTFSLTPQCPSCHRMFQTIEPRSFSFNSPYGACARCTGLGRTLEVDPELVIPNPRLTLAEGAIQPWTRIVGNQQFYHKLLSIVADRHGFSIDVPVKDLPQSVINMLYYGTDGQEYPVDGKQVHFEGVVPNLTQRHAETTSDYIRKEIENYMREKVCPVCKGRRLKLESLHVKIGEYSIADIMEMNIDEALRFLQQTFSIQKATKKQSAPVINAKQEELIATPIVKEIVIRLNNLSQVGLSYLSLDRSLASLSGGESQRVRLSTQLSTGLTGVIYVLDEPSVGLHPRDSDTLIATLKQLRDLGNSVIVVEHDKAMMEAADYIIDVGPGAGIYGGELIAEGTPEQIKKTIKSVTGQYLAEKASIPIPKKLHKGNGKEISIVGAKAFNLKNIDVSIPLGKLVCVTGVSGSGKTTLIHDILGRALNKHFYRAKAEPGQHKKITGISHINKIIAIDQSPIGRTPRSNPATYTGVFTAIRDLFTEQPEAKLRGYDAGKFSFNVKGGGRCEACAGEGYVRIPMQFLTDVFVECSECEGKRYTRDTLDIHYKQKTIADVLEMTVEEATAFFAEIPAIADKLHTLRDVGLGYVHLGQPATTLSGGEAQRVKLATELSRKATGDTLYILDEPTSGLHFDDIKKLLHVLTQLVDKGNTVLIIEHNLDIIKCADWIIDIGPEGGKQGGEVVAEGTPNDVVKVKGSWTGKYLKTAL